MKNSIAICPGSFDPITYGHLDIICRAAGMFDKVIVVVASNKNKTNTFTPEERVELIKKCIPNLPNVEVEAFGGLLADFAPSKGAKAAVKGLRAVSDLEDEFQMALTNKKLNPNVETLFLTTATQNMYLSSSMVKQIASMNGDISSFVPEVIKQDIIDRIVQKNNTK